VKIKPNRLTKAHGQENIWMEAMDTATDIGIDIDIDMDGVVGALVLGQAIFVSV